MKVSVAKNAGSVVELDIAADEEEFAQAMNQAYRRIVRDINIPGFRKGKAPRHIVERMIGREALIEEAGMGMMDDLYRRALEQENLVPVAEPEVNVTEVNPIAFHVSVQVYPDVTLGDYTSVKVEPREITVEESEVDETIETLRKNVAEWVELDEERKPQDEDQVLIDMTVYNGDEVFQEPAEDMPWVLGESGMFESLQDALRDMEIGQTEELTLAFDEDDETVSPEVRGLELRYVMTLKGINVRDLPEVDDEFAGKIGGLDSVEAMRNEIKKDLLRNKITEAETEVMNEIVNSMAELSEVDVPVALVDTEIDNQVTQMGSRLSQSGMDLQTFLMMTNQTEEEFREEMREDAARRVRNSLVLQQVTEEEGLTITDADIEAEIDRMTEGMENPDRMRSIYQSDYFRERLESELQDRKITERILEIATGGAGAVTGDGVELLKQLEEAEAAALEEEDITVEVTSSDDVEAGADESVDEDAAIEPDEETDVESDEPEAAEDEAPEADDDNVEAEEEDKPDAS